MANEMSRHLTFTEWLLRQRYGNDPIAHLAKDVASDKEWPSRLWSLRGFREYMENCNAHPRAIDALEDAWTKYNAWKSSDESAVVPT